MAAALSPSAFWGYIGAGVRALRWQSVALELPELGVFTSKADATPDTGAQGGAATPSVRTKRKIDLYFQVALTRAETQAQGVALLFIENFIPSQEDDPAQIEAAERDPNGDVDTDFDVLVKALLAWAVYTYAPDSDRDHPDQVRLSLAGLEDLYDSVVKYFNDRSRTAEFLMALEAFLADNFSFNITDRPLAESAASQDNPLSAAIFPMIPKLSLKVGDQIIDFDGTKRSSVNLQAVQEYTHKLLVEHGSTVEQGLPRSQGASPSLSIAELIFVDYFALLLRLTLQSAIDYVEADIEQEQSNPLGYTISLTALLRNLDQASSFKHQAGTTSRFLLHGLRLPGSNAAKFSSSLATEALYKATLQQFAPHSTGETPAVQPVILQKPAGLSWVEFTDTVPASGSAQASRIQRAPRLHYDYFGYEQENNLLTFVNELNAVDTLTITEKIHQATVVPFYSDAIQRYSLRHHSLWQAIEAAPATTSSTLLLTIPTDLQSRLHRHPNGLAVTLKENTQPQAGTPVTDSREGTAETDSRDWTAPESITWSTKVRLKLSQITQIDEQPPLQQIYQVIGTDEGGKELLDVLLETGAPPQIHLLYPESQQTGGERDGHLISQPGATVQLVKTNLALKTEVPNQSGQQPVYRANLASTAATERQAFLKFILETTSLESGGYYLHYAAGNEGLPPALFNNGGEAEVILLIQVDGRGDRAFPFHNCVAIALDSAAEAADLSQKDIYAESPIAVKALNLPSGNLGFRVERPAIPIDAQNDTATDELENLYQLLSYSLTETPNGEFQASPAGLPIGPAADDPDTDLDDGLWIYERVIPVYKFAKPGAPSATPPGSRPSHHPALIQPVAAAAPYQGISETASVTLAFHWQDLYGNRLQPQPAFSSEFPVRYFDELLGINQWPAVTESFTFTPLPDSHKGVHLNLELAFDQSKYQSGAGTVESEVQKKISSDRALYEKIYYQIHRSDLTFTAQTSLLWKFHTVRQGDTLAAISATYHVPVESIAVANQFVLDLFARTAGTAGGTPTLQIPLTGQTTKTTTLQAIARACLQVEALLASGPSLAALTSHLRTRESLPAINDSAIARRVTQLISEQQSEPNRLRHGSTIGKVLPAPAAGETAPPAETYTVKYGDTLADVAAATHRTLDELAVALLGPAARDVTLAPNTSWTVNIRYPLQPGDSLDSIRQKVELVTQNKQHQASDFPLSSDYLTIAAMAKHNSAVALNPALRSPAEDQAVTALYVPERVTIADPAFLLTFVERAYHYLATLEQLAPYGIDLSSDTPQSLTDLSRSA
jgi:LysM repeat protein